MQLRGGTALLSAAIASHALCRAPAACPLFTPLCSPLWHCPLRFKHQHPPNFPKQPQHFDDRVGPLGLCAAVVTALSAILIVSFVDFLEFLESRKDGPSPGPAPGPVPSPALAGFPGASVGRMLELAAGMHTRQ